jgi:hypothetical protein
VLVEQVGWTLLGRSIKVSAREHLHDLARSLEFMLLDQKEEWLAARLEDPDYGESTASAPPPAPIPSQA